MSAKSKRHRRPGGGGSPPAICNVCRGAIPGIDVPRLCEFVHGWLRDNPRFPVYWRSGDTWIAEGFLVAPDGTIPVKGGMPAPRGTEPGQLLLTFIHRDCGMQAGVPVAIPPTLN